MKIQETVKNLRRLGIEISDFEIDLLGCLYDVAGGFSRWVTAKQIWQQVTSRAVKSKKLSKTWFYKGLNELSEDGFVLIDRIARPVKYMITKDSLAQGVERKKGKRELELRERKKLLSEKEELLRTTDSNQLATEVMNFLKGERLGAKSEVIEGLDNIRAVIDQEIIGRAGTGDEIWTVNPIFILESGLLSSPTDRKIIEATFRGVKVKGLMILTGEGNSADLTRLGGYMKNVVELFTKSTQLGNLEVRVLPPGIRTYRILGVNKDRIMLYLTDVAQADIAAFIRYEDNPSFIEDAIISFEKLWAQAQDFLGLIMEQVARMKKEQQSL
ncbi:MAG: hypothetical protein EAX95_08380 [Candidatus Thorarchaeota archaeon]|nr:hypothetical protein [Candidatus Thorarchaeota archaeon]